MRRSAWLLALCTPMVAVPSPAAVSVRSRPAQDEVIYFLLPDRFENGDSTNDRGGKIGGRLVTGYDPADKGFYHGGDLKGIERRLDYIQDLGATALWLGPIFTNKTVQGPKGAESAGYHGYWITDFGRVDPHFGTNSEFKQLVEAAHSRGLKVYMDIVVNHTADVIAYHECGEGASCRYRSRADFPYTRRGGVGGSPINTGFAGDSVRSQANFAKLTDPRWAYTPYVAAGEAHVKQPEWLNDVGVYHNRGNSTMTGESATMGDFFGLDDLMTENPKVVQGMIDIYGGWIDQYGVDGFRIDTERHVEPEFWQAFVPAMLARASARGILNFHIFGEVAFETLDVGLLARHTIVDGLPSVLDFGFRQAVLETVARGSGTDVWNTLFDGDALYAGGAAAALSLPTFVSNHDAGRLSTFIRLARPGASDDEVLRRVELAYAMLLTMRGVPVIYAGDEQGFVSDGGDKDAREDMFASRVASYNDNRLLGTATTTAVPHFGEENPLFREIAMLSRLRRLHPALTHGRQIVRESSTQPGLLAISRLEPKTGREILLAFNTGASPVDAQVEVEPGSSSFSTLAGSRCSARSEAPGSVHVSLQPLRYSVCEASSPQ